MQSSENEINSMLFNQQREYVYSTAPGGNLL